MAAFAHKILHAFHRDQPAGPGSSALDTEPNSPPTFSSDQVTVIFVLGGPGAGKGTQCSKLVADYGFVHLSAGDLLRFEQQREGSTYGKMIKECIREGQIVPMEVTIKLLEDAIKRHVQGTTEDTIDTTAATTAATTETSDTNTNTTTNNNNNNNHPSPVSKPRTRFLIDGFPRKMDQAIEFDRSVCESKFILFLTCPEEKLLERLRERGKTSGRDDDNEETIKKRFRTFLDTSMPVVDYYRGLGKVVEIDSSPSVDIVYANICQHLQSRLGTSLTLVAQQ